MSHLPMNLEIEPLSSLGHDSIDMKAQHLSYHSCWVVKTYWACMTFSKSDFSFVMLLTQCNAMQRRNLNLNACYMTSTMHYKNLNLSCQVWTLGKLLHDEPFFMPWAKQRPPAHARPMFLTILIRLDKPLAHVQMKCIYMTKQLQDVRII